MRTGADVPLAPWSSVATAVSLYSPRETFSQLSTNGPSGVNVGKLVRMPRLLVPSKNSIVCSVRYPSGSLPLALNLMLVGPWNIAPSLGVTNRAVGGRFVGGDEKSVMNTVACWEEPTR